MTIRSLFLTITLIQGILLSFLALPEAKESNDKYFWTDSEECFLTDEDFSELEDLSFNTGGDDVGVLPQFHFPNLLFLFCNSSDFTLNNFVATLKVPYFILYCALKIDG